MADKDLDDIGSLVEQTLNILQVNNDVSGYTKIALDTPSKGPPSYEDVERSPDNTMPKVLDPLTPDTPGGSCSDNIDLGSPSELRLTSVRLNSGFEAQGSVSPDDGGRAAAARITHPEVIEETAEGQRELHASEISARISTAGSGIEPLAANFVRIRVKEPEKAEETNALGLKKTHNVYVVHTDSNLPGLLASGMEVRRRFSEFDTLHRLLHAEFRGCFIPPLPQKALFIENNSDEFLRLRRADLQAFLRAVVAHPTLQQSEVIRVFLLQQGDLTRNPAWMNLVSPPAAVKRAVPTSVEAEGGDASPRPPHMAGQGSAALANLGNWVSWMKHSTIAVFQPPRREFPADEANLKKAKEMLQDLERLLQLATQSARTLCQDMEKLSTDYHELGFNMGMLTKYEEAVQAMVGQYSSEGHSAKNRAADYHKVAACSSKQKGVWKALALKTAANLVTLHDYYILVPEALKAMEEREAALEHVFQLEEDLAAKKYQLAQLQSAAPAQSGGGKGLLGLGSNAFANSEKRSYQLSQSIAILEDQLKAAREQYALVKGRNTSELARMGLEREVDFRRMMASFAATQASLVQASAELWASLAKQFAEGL